VEIKFRDFVDRIKLENNIVDVVGEHIKLKQVGSAFQGICLFHPDTKPSFTVYEDHFHCFGCRKHGDVVSFIMDHEGLSFLDAVRYLAKRAGMPMPERFGDSEPDNKYWQRRNILELTADYYARNLEGKALEYCTKERKIDKEFLEKFRIGYADGGLVDYLKSKGVDLDLAAETGVIKKQSDGQYIDYFTNHIVFSYLARGETVNMIGRNLDDSGPKYLNLTGERHHLFNEAALRHSKIILVEGSFDCLSLEQAGYHSAALVGTNLKDEWLSKFNHVKKVYVCLDGDKAGQEAYKSICQKLGIKAYVAALPDGKDVSDLFMEGKEAEFAELFKSAKPWFDVLLSEIESLSDADKVEAIRTQLVPLLSTLQGVEREAYLKKASAKLKLGIRVLGKEVDAFSIQDIESSADPEPEIVLTESEKAEAIELLKSPDLLDKVLEVLWRLGCVDEIPLKLMLFLAMVSRLFKKPINVVVTGQASTGKSYVVYSVSKLFPPEAIKDVSRVTKNALYYLPSKNLKHKVLIIAERHGSEESDYTIRTMQSEGGVSLLVPIKNEGTGNITTDEKRVEGPLSFIVTTTEGSLHDENSTRVFIVSTDDSSAHTARVLDLQRQQYIQKTQPQDNIQALVAAFQNAQRLLRGFEVVMPFAGLIEFPTKLPRARRDHDRFLTLIAASAFFHQYQREHQTVEGQEYVVASIKDYEIAYSLAGSVINQTLMKRVSQKGEELVNAAESIWKVLGHGKRGYVTRPLLCEKLGWRKNYAKQFIDEAVDAGCLEVVEGRAGKLYQYRFVKGIEDIASPLLTPEELETRFMESQNNNQGCDMGSRAN